MFWSFTLHVLHLTLRTLDFTHHTLHFTLYTSHSTVVTCCDCTACIFTLSTPHSRLHTLHSEIYTLQSTCLILHCILYIPHSTFCTCKCKHSTLYVLLSHCTFCTTLVFKSAILNVKKIKKNIWTSGSMGGFRMRFCTKAKSGTI